MSVNDPIRDLKTGGDQDMEPGWCPESVRTIALSSPREMSCGTPPSGSPRGATFKAGAKITQHQQSHYAKVADARSLTLHMGTVDCAEADRALHLSVVRELLGKEIQDLIRSELLELHLGGGSRTFEKKVVKVRTPVSTNGDAAPKEKKARESSSHSPARERTGSDIGSKEGKTSLAKQMTRQITTRAGSGTFSLHGDSTDKRRAFAKMIQSLAVTKATGQMHLPRLADWFAGHFPCMEGFIRGADKYVQFLGTPAPLDQVGSLRHFLESKRFETLVTFLIILNCVFMVYAMDYEIAHYTEVMPISIAFVEAIFFLLFFTEIVMKLICYRLYFFFGDEWKFNCLDFLLVLVSAISLCDVFLASSTPMANLNLQWVRALRMFRLLKILRVLRVIQQFKTLKAILQSIVSSVGTLFWSMVMLVLFLVMFSMFFVQRVAAFFAEGANPLYHAALLESFGSVLQSVVTLFAATNGGVDWKDTYDLLEPTGWLNQTIFCVNIFVIQLAIINIITGMFVETSIKSMAKTREQLAVEHAVQEKEREKDLRMLCDDLDKNQTGYMEAEDWEELAKQQTTHSYFEMLGLRSHDVIDYFDMLLHMSDDHKVSIDEFVNGCMRLKGTASCFDTQTLLSEIKVSVEAIKVLQREVKDIKDPGRLTRASSPSSRSVAAI